MKKINFKNDYSSICHPTILKALQANLDNVYNGYGMDTETNKAIQIIKQKLNKECDIHFLPGGTITNKVLIAHTLKPYEAVISPTTGHINTHETGCIEEGGHKVLTVPSINGKLLPKDIINICKSHTDEHMVKPKMVYISSPTELGTVYTLSELKEIRKVCDELNLYFYLDGARLGSFLTSPKTTVTLPDLANLLDAFYIGGTKNGLLLGEALVIINDNLKEDFRYSIKHFGGMYAKGFVNGIQFKTLFENDLLFEIGKQENTLANKLYLGLRDLNINFLTPCESNQIFPILPKDLVSKIKDKILFEIWDTNNEFITVRFVLNYLNTMDDVNNAIKLIKDNLGGK